MGAEQIHIDIKANVPWIMGRLLYMCAWTFAWKTNGSIFCMAAKPVRVSWEQCLIVNHASYFNTCCVCEWHWRPTQIPPATADKNMLQKQSDQFCTFLYLPLGVRAVKVPESIYQTTDHHQRSSLTACQSQGYIDGSLVHWQVSHNAYLIDGIVFNKLNRKWLITFI